ncbi:MAG: 5-formyltetrahydrofolate cyclo-ligase [Campylobacterota bacterium]
MDKKKAFRSKCRQKLSKVNPRTKGGMKTAKKIKKVIQYHNARVILLYLPMPLEPDMMPLIYSLRKNRTVLVPKVTGKSFAAVTFSLPLARNRFGIYEPRGQASRAKIDLAVVPVLGVDKDCKRVGFGKGMYDRFYERLGYRPFTLFVQNTPCISKEKITDSHDISADIFITPDNTYYRGIRSVTRNSSGRGKCRRERGGKFLPHKKPRTIKT